MDETLLFPSPNWFLVSNLAVSNEGWIIYGGPSKSICVLEPLNQEHAVITENQSYRAHVVLRVHYERVVSVAISPEFQEKKIFLSGGADGNVKQWLLEKVNNKYKFKTTHSHDIHHKEKEEVTAVGYSTESIAISAGNFGNVVKWDLASNVCKTYNKFLPNFKVTSISCSPHIPLNVAIGTKQGVVFVLDLSGDGKVVYKVRSQDDEITNVSWCPQYEVLLNKTFKTVEKKLSASARMEAIRNEPETEVLEQSGIVKNLPEDSFDDTVVEEDDMFDIYKDHQADEFGHKKYEPEEILVKVKEEKSDKTNYLDECMKLKEDILKRKNQGEPSIESLVEAVEKTHVSTNSSTDQSSASNNSGSQTTKEADIHQSNASGIEKKTGAHSEASLHSHKHLLATIGRLGGVRIWSKSGRLVASCVVNKGTKQKSVSWPTLLWYTPNILLLVDAKSQLFECNPLQIDCKNKLETRVVHSLHKRGLYALVSDAPRVQKDYDSPESPDYHESQNWSVYSASQDRNIVRYSMKTRSCLAVHNTCGGFVYNVHFCPYDAGKMAISVGDGAIRVWRSTTLPDDDTKLFPGKTQSYWQNVQGKVLTVAWHHTKENLLAFGTGESRVGILEVSGKGEKPARVLCPAMNGGVYSLSWGEDALLYAAGGGHLLLYNTNAPDDMPSEVNIVVEGQKWDIGSVSWNQRGLLCGSQAGAVAVLDPTTHEVLVIGYIFSKMIHMIEWHPLETSNSGDESPHKNLIAVCSLDKNSNIIILEYKVKEDDAKELATWKTLSGHKSPVLQIGWSPHRDELILSTSQDATVRVWDVVAGTCVSIFANHEVHTLGAAWLALPQFDTKLVSGGGDCCLRLWDYTEHSPLAYQQQYQQLTTMSKRAEKKLKKGVDAQPRVEPKVVANTERKVPADTEPEEQVATHYEKIRKVTKRYILPIMNRQINTCGNAAVKKVLNMYITKTRGESAMAKNNDESGEIESLDKLDFVNVFGSINDVNKVLDMEAENLLEADLVEGWMTLSILRGQIDSMIQFASQKDMLCPYLLSMTPCVSFKYWKEATQLYLAQIDRMIAKGDEDKICSNRYYGNAIYRKATTLLSIHDVKGAVAVLTEAKLFKEAYVLCRIRYMDSIAEETLRQWATYSYLSGNVRMSAICRIALGELSEAATNLSTFNDQETLSLAADIAKISGRTSFADHVEKKAQVATVSVEKETEELLAELPSRIEMLMKDIQKANGNDSGKENSDHNIEANRNGTTDGVNGIHGV